jgi:UDP-N-acetylmuramoyl-tripeptide--D-alanyl-D-alanine ligase
MTLLRLRPEHRAAVVEIAMNHPGEIALLAALAAPGAALITNAGSAHLEGLGSLEAIAREKASLGFALRAGEPLFAGADSPRLLAALAGVKARLVTYGFAKTAEVRPRRVEDLGAEGSRLEVAGFPPIHLRLIGAHQVANALGALAVARELRLDPAAVAGALAAHRPTKGRMEVRRARGATLLVDYYNANPESTAAALETLEAWPDATRRIAVLGDMLELGEGAAALHRETTARIRGAELWAVGSHAADYAAGAAKAKVAPRVFAELAELKRELAAVLAPGVVVLL